MRLHGFIPFLSIPDFGKPADKRGLWFIFSRRNDADGGSLNPEQKYSDPARWPRITEFAENNKKYRTR
jgi:hypothetical protein